MVSIKNGSGGGGGSGSSGSNGSSGSSVTIVEEVVVSATHADGDRTVSKIGLEGGRIVRRKL